MVGAGISRKATPMNDVREILSRIEDGDGKAAEEFLPLVYDELRKLAARKTARRCPLDLELPRQTILAVLPFYLATLFQGVLA
jgi:hypothetical protein